MLLMPNSLSETYQKIENLKGKRLALFVIPLFLCCILFGIIIGNFIPQLLNVDEVEVVDVVPDQTVKKSVQYQGRVIYVDPRFYPLDNISYYLEDPEGNEIVKLKADDEKLTVVEGLHVIVFGELENTVDGEEDVLIVERVLVRNK